jgi:hypothetical protein
LEDVKIKLAGLWVAAMFCYLYADVLAFFVPGHLADLIAGEIGGIALDDVFIVASAIFMLPPILMIFLSLELKYRANRWANIIVGLVYTLMGISMVATLSAGYVVYGIVETLLTVLVLWYAWKWPEQEGNLA